MSFLYPQFLWAFSALAVPVIIHFFNFRRHKTVYFSNNRMLQAVDKQSKSINRIRQLLIMLTRMLAIAALVLAFAQPFIPATNINSIESSYASIYIDNSLSMKAKGENGPLLNDARKQAVEIIQALPNSFKIQIITNSFKSNQQRYYSKKEAIDLVDAIKPSPAFREVNSVISRVSSVWQNRKVLDESKLQFFLISDFQKSTFDNIDLADQEQFDINLVHLNALNNNTNLAIDSVWLTQPVLQPNFDQTIKVSIKNYSAKEYSDLSVQLFINNELSGAKTIKAKGASKSELDFTIRPNKKGLYKGELKIEAGEPYFDNSFFFSFTIDESLEVLSISSTESSPTFEKLYGDSIFNFRHSKINKLDYGSLKSYDLIILEGLVDLPSGLLTALNSHLKEGKNIVVFPSITNPGAGNAILNYMGESPFSNLVTQEIKSSSVSWQDPLFKNVFSEKPSKADLPKVNQYLKIKPRNGYPLVSLENQDPLVIRYNLKGGQLILFTTELEEESSNLKRHPLFVPLMLNSALYSTNQRPLYSFTGRYNGLVFNKAEENDKPLSIVINENELIPQQRSIGKQIEIFNMPSDIESGTFEVREDNQVRGLFALNTDPRESEWAFWEELDFNKLNVLENLNQLSSESISSSIKNDFNQKSLWKWFLIGALLFLLFEIILLKIWK
jgi:hypothetical protein